MRNLKKSAFSCEPCRRRKVKCGGEQPTCNRCAARLDECVYKLSVRPAASSLSHRDHVDVVQLTPQTTGTQPSHTLLVWRSVSRSSRHSSPPPPAPAAQQVPPRRSSTSRRPRPPAVIRPRPIPCPWIPATRTLSARASRVSRSMTTVPLPIMVPPASSSCPTTVAQVSEAWPRPPTRPPSDGKGS